MPLKTYIPQNYRWPLVLFVYPVEIPEAQDAIYGLYDKTPVPFQNPLDSKELQLFEISPEKKEDF